MGTRILAYSKLFRVNTVYGGRHRITNTVTLSDDTPVPGALTRLVDRSTGRLAFVTQSAPVTAAYTFDFVDGSRDWIVYALHPTGAYNIAVADRPPMEPIP